MGTEAKAGKDEYRADYPRLFFIPDKIEPLRHRIAAEGESKEAWLKLLERADNLLETEFVSEEHAEKGSGQHGNYGAPSSQIQNMGSPWAWSTRLLAKNATQRNSKKHFYIMADTSDGAA